MTVLNQLPPAEPPGETKPSSASAGSSSAGSGLGRRRRRSAAGRRPNGAIGEAGNSRWELVSLNPGNEGGGIAGMAFTGVAAMANGTAVIKA